MKDQEEDRLDLAVIRLIIRLIFAAIGFATRVVYEIMLLPIRISMVLILLPIKTIEAILLPVKLYNLCLLALKKNPARTKENVLSVIYLNCLVKKNLKFKLILFLCAGIFFVINWKFPQMNLSIIPLVLLGVIGLLVTKELLMEYRIRKGLFGTNRTEAKALIEFIIKNSDDIDFTDSNGNLRRALLPKAEPATAEKPLPAFGEEASA